MELMPRYLLLVLGMVAVVTAHMELLFPPGIKSQWDPQTVETSKDYSMTIPINSTTYPCKGYATPENIAMLHPVATLVSGQSFTWKLHGTASHGDSPPHCHSDPIHQLTHSYSSDGGSCQVGISYDGMVTNTVLASWIGGCPLNPSYTFVVPQIPASAKALFTWQWWNREGNREEYQNCAVVAVVGTATTFVGPLIYRANSFADNTCVNTEGIEDVFPNPGTQVVYGGIYNTGLPKATISFADCKYNQNVAVTIAASGTGITGPGTATGVASGSINPTTYSLSGNVAAPSPGSPASPAPPPSSTPVPAPALPSPSPPPPPAPAPSSKPSASPSSAPSSQSAATPSNKASSTSPRPTESPPVPGSTTRPTSSSPSPASSNRPTSRSQLPSATSDGPTSSPSPDPTPDQPESLNPGRLIASTLGAPSASDSFTTQSPVLPSRRNQVGTDPIHLQSNLSTLAKILIGVGSLTLLSILSFILFIYLRRRRQRLARASLNDQVESATKPARTAPRRTEKYREMPEESSSGYSESDSESRSEESSEEEVGRRAGRGRRYY